MESLNLVGTKYSTPQSIPSCTECHRFTNVTNAPAKVRCNASGMERLLSEKHTSSSGLNPLPLSRCSAGVRPLRNKLLLPKGSRRAFLIRAVAEEVDTTSVQIPDQLIASEDRPQTVGGLSGNSPYSLDLLSASSGQRNSSGPEVQVLAATQSPSEDKENRFLDRLVNATLVGAAASYALTKMLTVDQDYWHGWTIYEIVKYAPMHNWSAYEEALKSHPVLAKMMISGIVYSLGDWMAQCYEGKPVLDFNRTRMIRSGLVGFCLHGSLSHFYYHFCEALFPFKEWWVVPLKVAFDQTLWSALWNSVYFITLGLLRFENPVTIFTELRATFFPLLTAGWKLWPFAHVITYGVIPVEQRLLWVDCVELVWVTILSMYSNERAEARSLEDGSSDRSTTNQGSGTP